MIQFQFHIDQPLTIIGAAISCKETCPETFELSFATTVTGAPFDLASLANPFDAVPNISGPLSGPVAVSPDLLYVTLDQTVAGIRLDTSTGEMLDGIPVAEPASLLLLAIGLAVLLGWKKIT